MKTTHLGRVAIALIAIIGSAFVSPTGSAPAKLDAAVSQPPVLVRLPYRLVRNRIVVPVHVNGRGPFPFMIDLGATGVGRIDSRLTDSLRLPAGEPIDNSDGVTVRSTPSVRVDRIRLGDFELVPDGDLITRDYNAGWEAADSIYFGLLGAAFFADVLLTLDYGRQEVVVSRGRLDPVDSLTVSYTENFQVPITVNGHSAMGFIDTGSSLEVHLPWAWVQRLALTDTRVVGQARRANNTFPISGTSTPVTITIGGTRLVAREANFSEPNARINIGSALLRGANVALTVDQAGQRIRLERR